MEHLTICEYDLFKQDILFIDGLTRVGKSMYNRIIASLENVTQPMFLEPLEQLLPMYKLGFIQREAFSAFMRVHFNERFYNYFLSRNLNFRYDDLTSIHNANNYKELFKNLSKNDGDSVVEEMENKRKIFQFQTHDILTHYSLFLDLGINVKIIEIFRHPIDTIHSWYKRGWGKRFDEEDKRNFTTLFKYKNKTIPHYAYKNEEEYLKLNEMEKCIFMHNKLLKESIKEYKQLQNKDNILILKYEDMLENPEVELRKITNFLKNETTIHTPKALVEARVPRKVDYIQTREEKLIDIKKSDKKLFDDVLELSKEYENNLYGLEK